VWLFESAIDTHWLSTWVCTHLPDRDENSKNWVWYITMVLKKLIKKTNI
jgi:hypothetical protein